MLAPGALEGVRILNLLDGLGAYGARLLRGLGADVVLVEAPGGTVFRSRRSRYVADAVFGEGDEAASLYFLHYCSGIRSLALDIEADESRPVLERLIEASDIVLDNGQLSRLGFDLDALASAGGGRAIVSITPFGLDGPRSHWLGSDLVCQSMSGMLSYFGYRGERPARFGQEAASEMSGLAAALGALIAVYGARQRGTGSVVDIAAQRVTALVSFQMANPSLHHQFGFQRHRRERGPGPPPDLHETNNGYFTWSTWRKVPETLALLEEYGLGDGLRDLEAELGVSTFMTDSRAMAAARAFAARFSNQELVEILQSRGLMGLPVQDANQVLADPFLARRAVFVEIEAPGLPAPLLDSGAPVRLSGTPYEPTSRPPFLGEHTAEILAELGLAAVGGNA